MALDSVAVLVREQAFPKAGETFCRACWQVTAGNPFFLHELLLELREDRVDPDASPEELSRITPPFVLRSVLVRLGRIHAPYATRLANATAILGDGATLRHAAALAEIDPEAAVDALDALAAAELLAPGEPLRFVHPLVRGAVYADFRPAAAPASTPGPRSCWTTTTPRRSWRAAPAAGAAGRFGSDGDDAEGGGA